jgi:hypothetical protein
MDACLSLLVASFQVPSCTCERTHDASPSDNTCRCCIFVCPSRRAPVCVRKTRAQRRLQPVAFATARVFDKQPGIHPLLTDGNCIPNQQPVCLGFPFGPA